LVTDALSTYLFTPSPDGDENLLREGIPREKIYRVGDIMVDSLLFHLEEAKRSDIFARLGLLKGSVANPESVVPYALLTLHRPSNVDERQSFQKIVAALEVIAGRIPIIFPVHPRTKKQLSLLGLEEKLLFHNIQEKIDLSSPGIHGLDPLGYLDFLSLMTRAKLVLTDSGGIQEETAVLGIPCLTLRDTTERPITIKEGTNILVWNDTQKIVEEAFKILDGKGKKAKMPEYWDGKTAERITKILTDEGLKKKEMAKRKEIS
jgi:UDP-N-acetylglucosamine 2-epimerase (non-hydrolysing)